MSHPSLALGGVLALGLVVRSIGIGRTNLWLDEANSWLVAGHPLAAITGSIQQIPGAAAHLPFYFVLLKLWMSVAGDSEAALRSLSVLFGVALLPLTYAIGRRLVGGRAALLATLLVAVSPLHVLFAQEARMYMLLALLAGACAWSYLAWRDERARDRGGGLQLAAYAVSAVLALYTHYGAVLLLLALGLDALIGAARAHGLRVDRDPDLRLWIAAQLLVGLAFLPFLLTTDRAAAAALQGWRTPLGWGGALRQLFLYFTSFVHGPYYFAHELVPAAAAYWRQRGWEPHGARFLEILVVFPLTLLVLVAVLAYPPRAPQGRRPATSPSRFLYLCLLVPLAAGVVTSVHQGLDFTRYFLFATPFLALLLGAGLVRLPAPARALALAVLLASAGMGLARYWKTSERDSDYRPVARLLVDSARPNETILVLPPDNSVSLLYYLRHSRLTFRTLESGERPAAQLPLAEGERAWLVVDYRSPLFRASPSGLRRELGLETVLLRRFGSGGSGVLVVGLTPESGAAGTRGTDVARASEGR